MRQIPQNAYVTIREKKPSFPVIPMFDEYLEHYGRKAPFRMVYDDLLDYQESFPLQNSDGDETYWDWVMYPQRDWDSLEGELKQIYAWLKTPDDTSFTDHLTVDRVEYCNFGNSKPFRIRIVNRYNDNHDYYYIKRADASRVYGLELEHILAPNRIDFLVQGNTLVEEHIAGVPGDVFLKGRDLGSEQTRIRIAKEFVKFSERCFAKLLGDMRSYNYVVVVTKDFDMDQIRVRAIDFDQQSYQGDIKFYLPQFYEENKTMVDLVWNVLTPESIRQYQKEERALMARRLRTEWARVDDLLHCMELDQISEDRRISALAEGLARYHHDEVFRSVDSMGQLTRHHLTAMVRDDAEAR